MTEAVVPVTDLSSITGLIYCFPGFFLRRILGQDHQPHQAAMMAALNVHRRISVVGCNSSGKDWVTGRCVLWWLHTRTPAKVLVYGPTHRQVHDIVFREARNAFYSARRIDGWSLGGRMYMTSRYEVDHDSFALGFATSDPFNLQGFHSPNLLVIVTEAHAISTADLDAIYRLNPARILLTGNALVQDGPFFDTHHGGRGQWHTMTITADDCLGSGIPGLITEEMLDDLKNEWGADSQKYRAAVYAEFPDDVEAVIVPLSRAREAAGRRADGRVAGPTILACDVAREGVDSTVVMRRQGDQADLLWRAHERDLMKVVGKLAALCSEQVVDTLVIDDTGLGGGVTDRLKEVKSKLATAYQALSKEDREEFGPSLVNTRIVAFKGGAKAFGKKAQVDFANMNAQCWWLVRGWIDKGGCIPDDGALIGGLGRRYSYQSDSRIILESKKDMAKKGIKSPDEADALAMTFARIGGTTPNLRFL